MDEHDSPAVAPEAPAAPAPVRLPAATWAKQKKTPAWQLNAAIAGERWPQGYEVTEAEYDDALERAAGGSHR